jgi:hypothetical protein
LSNVYQQTEQSVWKSESRAHLVRCATFSNRSMLAFSLKNKTKFFLWDLSSESFSTKYFSFFRAPSCRFEIWQNSLLVQWHSFCPGLASTTLIFFLKLWVTIQSVISSAEKSKKLFSEFDWSRSYKTFFSSSLMVW